MNTDYKRKILEKTIAVCGNGGWLQLTRDKAAEVAGVSTATINYHFDSSAGLLAALMQHAVETENLDVIAQGMVARKLPANVGVKLKRRALAWMGAL